MVCKEDVVTWFQRLEAYKRIDILYSLVNMCVPVEVRFFGTCLEDIGKRDFFDLRDAETRANNSSNFSETLCLRDKLTRRQLTISVSLLRSCNYICSNGLHKILEKLDLSEMNYIINNTPSDESPLDELLLLYTLAINHPAFTFEQKSVYGNILVMLEEENSRLKSAESKDFNVMYHDSPLQPCIPCPLLAEDPTQQNISVQSQCILMPTTSAAIDDLNMSRSILPPGLGLPPGLSLPSDHLPPPGYMPVGYSSPSHQPVSSMPWQSGIAPVIVSSQCIGEAQGAAELPPYLSSPLISRTSSPTRSASPTPVGLMNPVQESGYPKGSPRLLDRIPTLSARHGSVDTSVAPPTLQMTTSPLPDPLQEMVEKEMPNYLSNLQNYKIEEVKAMCDEELNDLGLPSEAVVQLRNIVTKLQKSNGICALLDKREPPAGVRRKGDSVVIEGNNRRPPTSVSPYMRPFDGPPPQMYPPPSLMSPPPANVACYTCIAVPSPTHYHNHQPQQQHQHHHQQLQQQQQHQQLYCMNHNLRNLRLDSSIADGNQPNSNSSSTSSSSSASHSPPETPNITSSAPQWDRGFSLKEPLNTERSSPGSDERTDKKYLEPVDVATPLAESATFSPQPLHTVGLNNNVRPRLPGLGRGHQTPPGVQTALPRGRGPKPVTVILEGGSQKVLPSCRPVVNGILTRGVHPPPAHNDRKMFLPYTSGNSTSQPPPPLYVAGGGINPATRSGDVNNVPYAPAASFLPQTHYMPMRTSGSIYPSFPQTSYIRPSFPYNPAGDVVYHQYHRQTPPPPPPSYMQATPVPTYATNFPPPKVSCYNCGHDHLASDCKESTMEEVTKTGQYHLDFAPYQKSGECTSEK